MEGQNTSEYSNLTDEERRAKADEFKNEGNKLFKGMDPFIRRNTR